jgi:hypothetical protein
MIGARLAASPHHGVPTNEECLHMETIKVRKQEHKNIYVHNDLSNAAYHFTTVI